MGRISIANIEVDRKEIMQQLSTYLMTEVELNREHAYIHHCKLDLAVFDCQHEPGVKIDGFVARMGWLVCTEAWLMGAVLVERFLRNTMGTLGPFNVHRLIITSLMIAMKHHADVYGVNKHFSKNLSMPTSDLNRMERVFLRYLDWETFVSSDQLAVYVEEKLLGRRSPVEEDPLSLSLLSEASSSRSEGSEVRKAKSGNLGRLARAIQYVRQRTLAEEGVPEQKKTAQTPDHKRDPDSGLTTATW